MGCLDRISELCHWPHDSTGLRKREPLEVFTTQIFMIRNDEIPPSCLLCLSSVSSLLPILLLLLERPAYLGKARMSVLQCCPVLCWYRQWRLK